MRNAVKKFKSPDLSVPIKEADIPSVEVECFGKEWDVVARECSNCAANEVCAILTQAQTKKVVKKLELEEGYFLDQQDFSNIEDKLLDEIEEKTGKMTSEDLVDRVFELSKSRDSVAVIEWIKRFVKRTEGLSIKDKIVYYE